MKSFQTFQKVVGISEENREYLKRSLAITFIIVYLVSMYFILSKYFVWDLW